jgi:sulfate adenylyltransferase large subunit
MATATTPQFSVQEFLIEESAKDLLRFSTAGSVDDGKSTLIGRLLYDTQSVYEDQIRSIEGKGTTAPGQIDFALLTDGLRAEREQGITIDVAYRYFATARRKFIIADTPGHEQYTRNMATGASTANATVVLIDATKGVLPQSRRHAYIASLLRVGHVIVAVNKMDLAGYSQAVFEKIERDFRQVLAQIAADTGTSVEAIFIPVSALAGDNVVHSTPAMPWYTGPSLLETLELLPASQQEQNLPFRFPVQRVVRPDHTFRGFAGQIASGIVRVGDAIVVSPSGTAAQIKRIVTYDGDLEQATAPLSVTLVLDREVDISRGDLIASAAAPAALAYNITASMVWMDAQPLRLNHRYLVKHASHTVPAVVTAVEHRSNILTLAHEPAETLEMNHIGVVRLRLLRPIPFDSYAQNRATGALILIDPASNGTAAAGMIASGEAIASKGRGLEEDDWGPVTAGERQSRWGHRGAFLELTGPQSLIDAVERSLFSVGAVTSRINPDADDFLLHPDLLNAILNLQARSGILTLIVRETESDTLLARTEDGQIEVDAAEPHHAVAEIHQLLRNAGIFISPEGANL